jgi:hypothetical protein
MKKDWHVLVFGVIYIISFSMIYSLGFIGLDYFFTVLILFIANNTFSLIAVLVLLAIERICKKTISEYIYIVVSLVIVFYLLFDIKSSHKEFGNYLYPLFKEDLLTLTSLIVTSHLIGYFGYKLIQKKLKTYAS